MKTRTTRDSVEKAPWKSTKGILTGRTKIGPDIDTFDMAELWNAARTKTRYVSATHFKAQCLALLDTVRESGETITVTKRGQPVAMLTPLKRERWKSMKGAWAGRVEIPEKLLDADTSDLWDMVREAEDGTKRRP